MGISREVPQPPKKRESTFPSVFSKGKGPAKTAADTLGTNWLVAAGDWGPTDWGPTGCVSLDSVPEGSFLQEKTPLYGIKLNRTGAIVLLLFSQN